MTKSISGRSGNGPGDLLGILMQQVLADQKAGIVAKSTVRQVVERLNKDNGRKAATPEHEAAVEFVDQFGAQLIARFGDTELCFARELALGQLINSIGAMYLDFSEQKAKQGR